MEELKAKIEELEGKIKELAEAKNDSNHNDVKIVDSEEEVVRLAQLGYDCQPVGVNKWLMRK